MVEWYGTSVVWVVTHPRRPMGAGNTHGLPHYFVFLTDILPH